MQISLGFQQKAEGICLIWECEGAGTMQDFIQQHGAIEKDLMRVYLGRLVTGLEALQERGFAILFTDTGNILLISGLGLNIEPPILDVTVAGCALPPGMLTLPKLILDGPLPRNMRKADVWLLGIVASEVLSGIRLTATSARRIMAQVQEKDGGSAWELFMPHDVAKKLDGPASDFLRQCFIV